MKLEVTIGNQHVMFLVLFVVALFIVGLAGAFSPTSSGGTPSIMGHSVDEVNWSGTIPKINTSELCLGDSCRTSWNKCIALHAYNPIEKPTAGSWAVDVPSFCKNGNICLLTFKRYYEDAILDFMQTFYWQYPNGNWIAPTASNKKGVNGDSTAVLIFTYAGGGWMGDDSSSVETSSDKFSLFDDGAGWAVSLHACPFAEGPI